MKQRKIIHIDMDAFFASVEMRDNPQYRMTPLAVGGSEKQRGVISTCNYAAREYGVRSAMSTAKALQLCPHLTVVRTRMAVYKDISRQIHAIYQRYTPIIEPLSLDEAYLDVTDCTQHHGSATLIAQAIRHDIFQELQLTASAGIAPIKFVAKVASDLNKPNGQCVIPPEQLQTFIEQLDLGKIPGVGRVTLEKLHQLGLFIGKDVKEYDHYLLLKQFGKFGQTLWDRCHGIDERPIVVERKRKSVGVERTFTHNIRSYAECWQVIEQTLFSELQQRLQKVSPELSIRKQGIKIKFADFQSTTIEHLHHRLELDYFKVLLSEILQRQQGREIRLLGLQVMLNEETDTKQLSFFE